MTTCACGKPSRQSAHTCLACHAAYMRTWRKTHPLTDEQRKKAIARSYANVYVSRGKLHRQPCMVCGKPNAQKHHPDYRRPLDVLWLCALHHQALHAARREFDITVTCR